VLAPVKIRVHVVGFRVQRFVLGAEDLEVLVEGFAAFHRVQLPVLDGVLMTAQLLDVGLEGLELTGGADLPGVEAALGGADLFHELGGLVREALLETGDLVAFALLAGATLVQPGEPFGERGETGPLRKRSPLVAETFEGEVAVLKLEEGVEVAHVPHLTGTDASPTMRLSGRAWSASSSSMKAAWSSARWSSAG